MESEAQAVNTHADREGRYLTFPLGMEERGIGMLRVAGVIVGRRPYDLLCAVG